MTKFKTLSFCQNGIKRLHANVQCVYIVYTKYQDQVSVKAVEQVEFPVHALLIDL